MAIRRIFFGGKGRKGRKERKEENDHRIEEVEEDELDEKVELNEKVLETEPAKEVQNEEKVKGPEDPKPLGAWNCFGSCMGSCTCHRRRGRSGYSEIHSDDANDDGNDDGNDDDEEENVENDDVDDYTADYEDNGSIMITDQPALQQGPVFPSAPTQGFIPASNDGTNEQPDPVSGMQFPEAPTGAPKHASEEGTAGELHNSPPSDDLPLQLPQVTRGRITRGRTQTRSSSEEELGRRNTKRKFKETDEPRNRGSSSSDPESRERRRAEFLKDTLRDQNLPRPAKRTKTGSDKTSPIPIPGKRPIFTLPSDTSSSHTSGSRRDIAEFGRIGAQMQAWIADPLEPGCTVERNTLTWEDVKAEWVTEKDRQKGVFPLHDIYPNLDEYFFRNPTPEFGDVSRFGLSTEKIYREITVQKFCKDKDGANGWNTFEQSTGPGVIFAKNISRHSGPHWSQVAQAQYVIDHDIKGLRYVFLQHVVNEQSFPYVQYVLYPRKGLNFMDPSLPEQIWEYGTREYQELLGTQLGKAVASLMLGAFERGTRRIERIVTWRWTTNCEMRFEIGVVRRGGLGRSRDPEAEEIE